ncbi:unnamed protein product [Mytilus coruscus]|uniref:Uncharacterized protein n=1 Tax=Mytilus coruscus TaxID=42192 RepID=A0A6J8EJ80_MYTCO|nr:unnamed protein product [Mytilus coruscus]
MATDSQWSGLLIVVIFVAIFAITSVSAMAIYFFCKCHRKKKKNMQVRPAPNRSRLNDEEDNEDGEHGVLFQRRDDGLQWVTNKNRYSPNARGVGEINKSTPRLGTPAVTGVGSNYTAPLNRSREDKDIFKSQRLVKVDEDGNYDSLNSGYIVPKTVNVNKIHKKRRQPKIQDNNVQYTGITDNYKTAQILRVDHHDDSMPAFGGIYRTPQRVRSRDSTSRGSCARSISPFGEQKPQESMDRENIHRGRRTADSTQHNPARFMFTASSKMAWGFDS